MVFIFLFFGVSSDLSAEPTEMNAEALYKQALKYDIATSISKEDAKQAVYWYEKAAEQGSVEAMHNLGVLYKQGKGGLGDKEKAIYWYKQAAEHGDLESYMWAGQIYLYDKKPEKAIELYEKGARLGSSGVQTDLAFLYHNGEKGIEKDYQKSVYWSKKVAEQNCVDSRRRDCASSMERLGDIYVEGGYGVEQDYQKAIYWYEKGAGLGNDWAIKSLGEIYEQGWNGVEPDYQKAILAYEKGVPIKDEHSIIRLGQIYEKGEGGIVPDLLKAKRYYRLLCVKGSNPYRTPCESYRRVNEQLNELQ